MPLRHRPSPPPRRARLRACWLGLLAGAALAIPGHGAILDLTGWNNDLVAEGNTLPLSSTSIAFSGWSYYVAGRTSNPSGTTQGLPVNGAITSLLAGNTAFQLQPYTANNAATILGSAAPTVTLTLATPASYAQLQLLYTAQTGGTTWTATVNFTDATSTLYPTFTDPDWTSSTGGNIAATNMGLLTRDADGLPIYSGTLVFREQRLNLSTADQAKLVQSITFDVATVGNLAVFAASGTAIPEPSTILLGSLPMAWLLLRRRRS